MSNNNEKKTLSDYQKIIKAGYTLDNKELRHMNRLWQLALEKANSKQEEHHAKPTLQTKTKLL